MAEKYPKTGLKYLKNPMLIEDGGDCNHDELRSFTGYVECKGCELKWVRVKRGLLKRV